MPQLQNLAQQVLDDALARQGRELGVSQGALVAMRPDGAVLAMVGGRDYRRSQFNRAADANRQPGSAFKLFVYLAALRKGYTPQDTIDAGPVDVTDRGRRGIRKGERNTASHSARTLHGPASARASRRLGAGAGGICRSPVLLSVGGRRDDLHRRLHRPA
jgi:membrane peptidoglycan carboxypeptidase